MFVLIADKAASARLAAPFSAPPQIHSGQVCLNAVDYLLTTGWQVAAAAARQADTLDLLGDSCWAQ